jgi:hypothetical protein
VGLVTVKVGIGGFVGEETPGKICDGEGEGEGETLHSCLNISDRGSAAAACCEATGAAAAPETLSIGICELP